LITLNYRDSRPIYEQIKEAVSRLILSGALSPGEKLPSVRELASQLAINPNTIQKAYHELEVDGFIDSIAGKGSFAANPSALLETQKSVYMDQFAAAVRELLQLGVSVRELSDAIVCYSEEIVS